MFVFSCERLISSVQTSFRIARLHTQTHNAKTLKANPILVLFNCGLQPSWVHQCLEQVTLFRADLITWSSPTPPFPLVLKLYFSNCLFTSYLIFDLPAIDLKYFIALLQLQVDGGTCGKEIKIYEHIWTLDFSPRQKFVTKFRQNFYYYPLLFHFWTYSAKVKCLFKAQCGTMHHLFNYSHV